MNTSLSTFMKLAVTAVVIAALLFSVGYQMLDNESKDYKTKIEEQKDDVLRGL